jgi:hypothetical protein
MDKETLGAAMAAEQAVRNHDSECSGGCQNVGRPFRNNGVRKRCPVGVGLWDTWDAFRPKPLSGSRIGPDGEEINGAIIVKTETMGPYTILTLRRDASKGQSVKDWQEHERQEFEAFVDGKPTDIRWYDTNLESVLLYAMDCRWNGRDRGTAAYYAGRVLGIPHPEDDDE